MLEEIRSFANISLYFLHKQCGVFSVLSSFFYFSHVSVDGTTSYLINPLPPR